MTPPNPLMPEQLVVDKFMLVLPADSYAVALARHTIAQKLRELDLAEEFCDDIILVTSELVTNAIEHGSGPHRLEMTRSPIDLVIQVQDQGLGQPVLRPDNPTAIGGRGLRLVEALAARWGWYKEKDSKYVWAAFSYPSDLA